MIVEVSRKMECFTAITVFLLTKLIQSVSPLPAACVNTSSSFVHCSTQSLEDIDTSLIRSTFNGSLRIDCSSDRILSSFEAKLFSHLGRLERLSVNGCKLASISVNAFSGNYMMKVLEIRSHNDGWSRFIGLHLFVDSFLGLESLELVELSYNGLVLFPGSALCKLHNLKTLNVSHNNFASIDDFATGSDCKNRLINIDLSHNKLSVLKAQSFSNFNRLSSLNLSNNALLMIDIDSFRDLNLLETLDLSNNNITRANPSIFQPLVSLKVLNLSGNALIDIDSASLDKLLVLDLAGNRIPKLSENSFQKLYRLLILRLSGNVLTEIEHHVFGDLRSLQVLHLDSNKIESISPGAFAGISNLHILSLSNNRLTKLDGDTFHGLRVLNALHADFNKISYINAESFRNLTNLQEVTLYGNRLKDIPVALRALVRLRTLDLGNNKLEELRNSSFLGLSNLYALKLSENIIHEIECESLRPLRALKILNLARNALYDVMAEVFESLYGLEALRLDGNQITNINGLFNQLQNLTWLNISYNQLESFDYALLPQNVVWLDMRKNNIQSLDNFYNIQESRLEYLDASFNRISVVSASSVPNAIRELLGHNNQIVRVDQHTFAEKRFLKRVNLRGNLIERLEPASLRIHPEASDSQFLIGGNPFRCDCNMEWLLQVNQSSLYPLVADYGEIECSAEGGSKSLSENESFFCEYTSHCFALCHCCDFEACDCEMSCPANCTCAHDSAWASNIVDCSTRNHDNVPLGIPMDATEVRLDGNVLRMLYGHSFLGKKNMLRLFLNSTGTTVIPKNIFSGLRKLVDLHLENNLISRLDGFEFENLDSLVRLHLQFNRLEYIERDTFAGLQNLELLQLQGNRLRHFAVWELPAVNILEIRISENPWSCDCGFLTRFRTWIAERDIQTSDGDNVFCLADDIEYKLWNHSCSGVRDEFSLIYPFNFSQDYSLLLLVSISLTALLLITILLAIFNRQSLYYRIYGATGYRMSQCRKCLTQNKMYDIFLNYSVKDECFIAEQMTELHENHFRMCMQHRELQCGVNGESIYMAENSSKFILIILTNSYVQSEWYRPGVKSMLLEMSSQHPHRIIVLVIEEVRDGDSDLRKLLRTVPVIFWKDKWKWSKLRYYLPQGRRGRATVSPYHMQPLPLSIGHYEELNKHIYSTLEHRRT